MSWLHYIRAENTWLFSLTGYPGTTGTTGKLTKGSLILICSTALYQLPHAPGFISNCSLPEKSTLTPNQEERRERNSAQDVARDIREGQRWFNSSIRETTAVTV